VGVLFVVLLGLRHAPLLTCGAVVLFMALVLPPWLFWPWSLWNLFVFGLFYVDKERAKTAGQRRIPERLLLGGAVAMGALGAAAGMRLCRHKTKHWYFTLLVPLVLIGQIGLVGFFSIERMRPLLESIARMVAAGG
jgi:uncharacterized membrane protein YsdA (DUF1294 family)